MKTETIEEYLKRGGTIQVLPAQPSPPASQTVYVKDQINLGELSLGGSLTVYEDKPYTSKVSKLSKLLTRSWMPQHIKDSILQRVKHSRGEA